MDYLAEGEIIPKFWHGKKVFLTGHTGFKGSWMSIWLSQLGCHVTGYSLKPEGEPSLFKSSRIDNAITSIYGDIVDRVSFEKAILKTNPDIIFHLAAQPIVSTGYTDPVTTFSSNVMGVVNLLEICRKFTKNVPVVVVSSDKCYDNNNSGRAFQVGDPLGGHDPYSASKACTEIVVNSYRNSFFLKDSVPRIASARAGNVIGGGDWSTDRLIPDGARALSKGDVFSIRNPSATRPWQHVLEPLSGYLVLAQAMAKDISFAKPWNFGPDISGNKDVGTVAKIFCGAWSKSANIKILNQSQTWEEAKVLMLNCAHTHSQLGWAPKLDLEDSIRWTASWYKKFYENPSEFNVMKITKAQIKEFMDL